MSMIEGASAPFPIASRCFLCGGAAQLSETDHARRVAVECDGDCKGMYLVDRDSMDHLASSRSARALLGRRMATRVRVADAVIELTFDADTRTIRWQESEDEGLATTILRTD